MLFELRIRILWKANASKPALVHQKIENSKMLRIEFWTSDFDVQKWSKRPWDPENRIRLEKLCPKVVSDRQKAGRMTSKRRFWHFRPIRENRALNVNVSPLGGVKGGFWPHWARTPHVQRRAGGIRLGMSRLDRFRARQVDSETFENFGKIAPDCRELWLRNSGVWLRNLGVWHDLLGVWHDVLGVWHAMLGVWHRKLGVWHAMLGVWHAMLGVWQTKLGVWLRCWGNPHLV